MFLSQARMIMPLKRINTPIDPIRESFSPRRRAESIQAVIGSERERV